MTNGKSADALSGSLTAGLAVAKAMVADEVAISARGHGVDAIAAMCDVGSTDKQVVAKLVERAGDWDGFLERQVLQPHIIVKGKRE